MSKPHQENTSLPLPTISQATAQHRRCRLVTSADASIPDRRGLCLEPSSEPNQRVLPIASDNRAAHGCSDGNIRPRAQPVFEFASSSGRATPGTLLLRRPVALLALVPRPLVLFAAAAVAGAVGKTLTAPLDRVKLLLQTGGGLQRGSLQLASQKGLVEALVEIGKAEGIRGYWKGNVPQILKVVPYSAVQLYSYDFLKQRMTGRDKPLSVRDRMIAGACAGMIATLATYPLDTMRLRLAVDPSVRSVSGTIRTLIREGSYGAFFRGLNASLIGIAPYVALELSLFDTLPGQVPPFARGFTAAFIATSACYPLDTIRRQIQLQSTGKVALRSVLHTINQRGAPLSYYRGFVPNAVKNLPNKGIRLTIFDSAKKMLAASELALAEEEAKQQHEPEQALAAVGS